MLEQSLLEQSLLEQELVRSAVQWTARISALTFSGFLALGGLAGMWRASPLPFADWRRRLLAGFIAIHTVHFGSVLCLAAVSEGANIRERGGWVPILGVGFLFYFAVIQLWQEEKKLQQNVAVPLGLRRFRIFAVIVLWAAFVHSYAGRFRISWLFVGIAGLLTAAFLFYLVSLLRGKR